MENRHKKDKSILGFKDFQTFALAKTAITAKFAKNDLAFVAFSFSPGGRRMG